MSDWSSLMTPQKATLDSMHDSYPSDVSNLSYNFLRLIIL